MWTQVAHAMGLNRGEVSHILDYQLKLKGEDLEQRKWESI